MDDNLMLIKQFQMQGGSKGADAAFAEESRNYQQRQTVYMGAIREIRARLETLIARWNEDAVSAADILAVSTEAKNVVVNLSGGFAAWLQTLDGDAAREKVYSMVNTMTQGRSQQGVIFFFNGEQLDELSGGLCMRGRLTRNPGMVVNDDGSMGVL